VVVVFSPQLYEGQLRGWDQAMRRSCRELEEMSLHPARVLEAARRKLNKIRDLPISSHLTVLPGGAGSGRGGAVAGLG
jgi:hypothetical protein